MTVAFLGTRGEIEAHTRRHRRHTATLVSYRGRNVMIDCGLDWLGQLNRVRPDAVVVTHAHPDHAWGLRQGAPCPVYATQQTWALIDKYPIEKRHVVEERDPFRVGTVRFEAFAVEHSVRAPAVGYRMRAGRACVFYAPDLVAIARRHEALAGVQVYIGDGATISRPIVRRCGDALVGHAAIRTQLGWCQTEGIRRAIFTHCGSEIVAGDGRRVAALVRQLGIERGGVDAAIAHDGLQLTL